MKWTVFFVIAMVILGLATVAAIIRANLKNKKTGIFAPLNIMFAGVAIASVLLFLPIYMHTLKDTGCGIIETFFVSVHNMIRLFVVDGEFSFVTDNIAAAEEWVETGYKLVFSVLFVVAPVLTFGFVLSFFKNVSAYERYILGFGSDAFVFSELNRKSLILAKDLCKNSPKGRVIVFTDVFEKDEEEVQELIDEAKRIGAICFRKDIVTIRFGIHSRKRQLNFFTIGEDLSENIEQSLKIIEKMRTRENTNLYVFSTQVEAEMLLSNAFCGSGVSEEKNGKKKKDAQKPTRIKVRRVNEVRSLISRTLYEDGYEKIFCSAYDNGTEREINAVVIGMGQHGTEMTKALAWFCQMNGYRVTIDSFDIDKRADDKFRSLCPELMDKNFNCQGHGEEDANYSITVHPDVDVLTQSFDEMLKDLPRTTYVFVALGNDEKNISVAVKLRALYGYMGYTPVIQTVVYNSHKKEALFGVKNYRGQSYEIDFIGDIKTSYSERVILYSDIEQIALARHMKWGAEEEFWQFDYNYKSSVASAIHSEMKKKCHIPGADKLPEQREEGELWSLRKLEHRRWNAYMRTEGYRWSGSYEKSSRNDLAKLHHCLVEFSRLSPQEQEKDDD